MKLRIDPERLSFRLDLEEVKTVLDRGELKQITPLPDGEISYKVICLPAGSPPDFHAKENIFTLRLARNIIEDHVARLPSLRGIACQFPALNGGKFEVALEVNLKKKLKRTLES